MRKFLGIACTVVLGIALLTGCGNKSDSKNSKGAGFDKSQTISVVSREDGSGTRGAFIELVGVEEKDAEGNKVDNTTDEAVITNSTEVMMTTVAGDPNGIGYVSLGSLNDSVKKLKIDGAEATVDNIKSGEYKVARPFNIVTKDNKNKVAKDFMNYILSADGQKIVEDAGYISVSDAAAFSGNNPSGKIVVSGSSSVTPVMEKLQEAYMALNANAQIEVQESDSSTGIADAIAGNCDIGMASRDLKDEETSSGLTVTQIAMDGIAVVVNTENTIDELSTEQVKNIFTGKVTTWEDVDK